MTEVSVGLGAALLLVGFPALLVGVIWFLGWLESWMLMPDERAAKVHRLLEGADGADEVETAVARMLAVVADGQPRRDRDHDRLQRTAS